MDNNAEAMATAALIKAAQNGVDIAGITNKIGADALTTIAQTLAGAVNEVKQANSELSAYLKPIATYTHSGNKELVISAVDVEANTLTSVAHGCANNDEFYLIGNTDAGAILILDKTPGGLTVATKYYVVNKTDDTIQLSLTSGGAAIDITANANLDLTKWHFENVSAANVTVTGLPADLYNAKIKVEGRGLTLSNLAILLNSLTYAQEWATGTGAYNQYPIIYDNGRDVSVFFEAIIRMSKMFKIIAEGFAYRSTNNTTVTYTGISKKLFTAKYSNAALTSVTILGLYPANGTVVEVYKA